MSDTKRPFGVWIATAMVVGSMIGSGIFVLPAQMAPFGWTGVVGWLVAGAGVMLLAYILVDLTRTMPEEPNVVAICGKVLGGPSGMLIGWSYWVSIWVGDAAVATTAALYLGTFVPALAGSALNTALTGTAILAGLTAVNLTGARSAGRLQVLTVALKLLPLVAVIGIVAVVLPQGGSAVSDMAPFAAADLTPALGILFFALLGFEGAAIVTERVRDPERNVIRGTMWGVGLTALLYLALCTGMMLLVPAAELQAAGAPLAWFVERFLGSTAGMAVAAFAAISCIGYLNASVLFLGEVPLAAVRAGELSPWVARVNKRDVAVGPMVFGNLLSVGLMLVAATRSGGDVLTFMFLLTTSSSMILYAAACVAALVLGRKRLVAVCGLAFTGWIIWAIGFEAAAWGAVLVAAGLPLYLLARPSAPAQQPA